MRKIGIAMLLLLMMTCAAFAEEVPEGDQAAAMDIVTMEDDELGVETINELEGEPQAEPIPLSEVVMTLDKKTYYYEGTAVKPKPVLMYGEEVLVKDDAYRLEYSNNDGIGTATVTAVFDAGGRFEEGSKDLQFEIKDPINLSKATITLSKTKYYKTGKAIKPAPTLKYNGKKLTKGTRYKLTYKNNKNVGKATVTAKAIKGSGYTGSKSITFTIVPEKPDKAPISNIKSDKPIVKVTWKKVTCTGYQLQVSLNSDFSKAKKYKPKSASKKVPKLKDGKKYYFRVRAYNSENGQTTYGAWSKSSSKVDTTGPVGDMYSKDGAYIKDKTIKLDGNYYYYNDEGLKSGCSEKMWDKVKNSKSGTKYLIAVDCHKNRVCIYEGKKGAWKLRDYWKCTTGKSSTPTIKGNFKVCGKVSHFGESNGYSVWYATRIKYEYYFHSVLYKPYSKSTIIAGTLGKSLSHGCVRLKLKNAKWIYKNCKNGTRIITY